MQESDSVVVKLNTVPKTIFQSSNDHLIIAIQASKKDAKNGEKMSCDRNATNI
jgi:hypothetical protein